MQNENLTPISYIVLGLVELRGPSTPYELKAAINQSIGFFWSFSHGQFYNEPSRLVGLGLMSEEREEGGRRRRTFSITRAGSQALREWLAEPAVERREMRDPSMLKLFFAELARPEDVETLRQRQHERHRAMVAELEALQREFGDRDDLGYRPDTIEWGLLAERAFVTFWTNLQVSPAKVGRRPAPSRRGDHDG